MKACGRICYKAGIETALHDGSVFRGSIAVSVCRAAYKISVEKKQMPVYPKLVLLAVSFFPQGEHAEWR